MSYEVGVDIGGTFTDCVVLDEAGRITIGKALSTPDDFSRGALHSAANAANDLSLKKFVPTRVYDFNLLKPATEFAAPAIVETPVTTVVVNPRDRAAMDGYRNIRIYVGGA